MPEERPRAKVPYVYQFSFSSVAAGSLDTASPAVQIGARAFVLTHIAFYAEAGNDFSLLIRDDTMAQDLMNEEIHLKAISATNDRPFELPVPWRFEKNSTIYAEATNNGTAADSLHVLLIGYLD